MHLYRNQHPSKLMCSTEVGGFSPQFFFILRTRWKRCHSEWPLGHPHLSEVPTLINHFYLLFRLPWSTISANPGPEQSLSACHGNLSWVVLWIFSFFFALCIIHKQVILVSKQNKLVLGADEDMQMHCKRYFRISEIMITLQNQHHQCILFFLFFPLIHWVSREKMEGEGANEITLIYLTNAFTDFCDVYGTVIRWNNRKMGIRRQDLL